MGPCHATVPLWDTQQSMKECRHEMGLHLGHTGLDVRALIPIHVQAL